MKLDSTDVVIVTDMLLFYSHIAFLCFGKSSAGS